MGSSDASYGCVFQQEDSGGKVGVFLSKELMSIAGHALKANITTLGPLVLPLSEQIFFFINLIARKVSLQVQRGKALTCARISSLQEAVKSPELVKQILLAQSVKALGRSKQLQRAHSR